MVDNTYFDVDLFLPDADVIARQVVNGKKSLRKYTPSEFDLATLITNIKHSDTMKGSSTLVIDISDQEWRLMDSGFFDADQDGRLDPIDVNYPEGSEYWWRLQNSDIVDSPPGHSMNFMERAACDMMSHHGPMKISRAKRTRAEVLHIAARHVKKRPIHFHSKELHKKQRIDKEEEKKKPPPKKKPEQKKKDKDKGIHKDSKITFKNWDGSDYTLKPGELENAETVIDAAGDIDERPLLAVLCGCIVEAPFFRNPAQANSDLDSAGILQLRAMHGPESKRRDIAWCVHKFLNEGFTGKGGAVKLAKEHKDWTPGEIAATVQGPKESLRGRYQQVIDGAKKVLEAAGGPGSTGGGDGSGGGSYTKQYNFEIGTAESPHENFWDGSNRLAEEVKWALFLDGQDLYFDAETTLIKQKPSAIVDRDDAAVVSWSGTYDNRNIATEATLVMFCGMFEYRAGEVFKLERMGPLSTGSTAKLPGRWLISEIERSRYELTSTFTLKQPEDPAPEPASETVERPSDDSDSSSADGRTNSGTGGDVFDACKQISDEGHRYPSPDVHHGAFSSFTKNTDLDCSESTSLALHKAGYFDHPAAWVSGQFATSWGSPGRGTEWTVWANAGHVFIQSEGSGRKWRFDTGGHPGVSGPRLVFEHRSTAGFTARHSGKK